jgi:hypothetical protein
MQFSCIIVNKKSKERVTQFFGEGLITFICGGFISGEPSSAVFYYLLA